MLVHNNCLEDIKARRSTAFSTWMASRLKCVQFETLTRLAHLQHFLFEPQQSSLIKLVRFDPHLSFQHRI